MLSEYQMIPNASPIMPIIHELMVRNPISPRQETAPITGTSAGYCRYFDGILNGNVRNQVENQHRERMTATTSVRSARRIAAIMHAPEIQIA